MQIYLQLFDLQNLFLFYSLVYISRCTFTISTKYKLIVGKRLKGYRDIQAGKLYSFYYNATAGGDLSVRTTSDDMTLRGWGTQMGFTLRVQYLTVGHPENWGTQVCLTLRVRTLYGELKTAFKTLSGRIIWQSPTITKPKTLYSYIQYITF